MLPESVGYEEGLGDGEDQVVLPVSIVAGAGGAGELGDGEGDPVTVEGLGEGYGLQVVGEEGKGDGEGLQVVLLLLGDGTVDGEGDDEEGGNVLEQSKPVKMPEHWQTPLTHWPLPLQPEGQGASVAMTMPRSRQQNTKRAGMPGMLQHSRTLCC